MYQSIEINSFGEALSHLLDDSFRDDISRIRSNYVFRGMSNSRYGLVSSFHRNCSPYLDLETSILRNFSKYAVLEHPDLAMSIWRQMIVGQHHGLPTRLLDWSYSPLVALHFATDDANLETLDEHDAVVWKVNLEEVNGNLPSKYKEKLIEAGAFILTVDMLNRVANTLDEYDSDMGDHALGFMEPPSIDARIINQYALFSIIPRQITDLATYFYEHTEKSTQFIIKKEVKWEIRDILDQMNMNERILYPGLDGLAKWLKRHYFAKDS